MNILELCVRREDPILRAIQMMDRAHAGIALVVDGTDRLIGVVTDGDVRRAILEGVDLESPVGKLMTKDPVTVRDDTSDTEMVHLLQSAGYQRRTPAWIPVVDRRGMPVGLRMQSDLLMHGGDLGDRRRPSVRPARYILFQLAELALPRDLFAALLERIARLRPVPV